MQPEQWNKVSFSYNPTKYKSYIFGMVLWMINYNYILIK